MRSYDEFLSAVAFPEFFVSAAKCFRAARSLASELLAVFDSAKTHTTTTVEGVGRSRGKSEDSGDLGLGGAWAAEKSELRALDKIAVSNAVVALQVGKRLTTMAKTVGETGRGVGSGVSEKEGVIPSDGEKIGGRANVEFGAHSQFPTISVTFG